MPDMPATVAAVIAADAAGSVLVDLPNGNADRLLSSTLTVAAVRVPDRIDDNYRKSNTQ